MTVSTATSISLSWSVPSGSVVTEYLIEWQRDTSVGCSDKDQGNTTITDTSYTISGLDEDSRYTITVIASNTAGNSEVSNLTAVTEEAGERLPLLVVLVYGPLSHSSVCPSIICEVVSKQLHNHHSSVGTSGLQTSEWKDNRLLSEIWRRGE